MSAENPTHFLECHHCIGPNCRRYFMRCDLLKITKSGKAKVMVYGDRYWRSRTWKPDKARIRYVAPHRVYKRSEVTLA